MSRIAAMGKGYFHFPLCLLAFSEDCKQRLQHIVSYCLYEHAKRTNPKFPRSARNSSLDEAANFLGVRIGSRVDTLRRWEEANIFVCEWEGRHGKDARVRIATCLLWEAHNNTGIPYREFSILCAINSIIGNRRSVPRRITEPSIRVRAAGFKSRQVAEAELSSDEMRKGRLLTADQVRYTLEDLHERRFFARARTGARTVKYMLRVSDDQLRALLFERETSQARFKAERAKKDGDLVAAIRAAKRQPITVQSPPKCGNDTVPDIGPDINSCSCNNGSFDNSTKNTAPLSLKSGGVGFVKEQKLQTQTLNRSQFSDEELAFIDLYSRICLPAGFGFLPVTKRSEELDKVLDIFAAGFDAKEWTQNFREAVKERREVFRTNPCKYNTLVQICWKLN